MKVRYLTAILATAALIGATATVVLASQPNVRTISLKPQAPITATGSNWSVLLQDPFEAHELTIKLPQGFTAEAAEELDALLG